MAVGSEARDFSYGVLWRHPGNWATHYSSPNKNAFSLHSDRPTVTYGELVVPMPLTGNRIRLSKR